MARDKFGFEVTGNPQFANLESNIRRALDQVGSRTGDLTGASYSPADAANWSGSPPSTIAEALDRIAAALGPIA